MTVQILIGDCLQRLRELPDESVHMVVTSPPYFGLRNYQTGRWVGGDSACDHSPPQWTADADAGDARRMGEGGALSANLAKRLSRCGGRCPTCGARWEDGQIGQEPTPAEFVAVMVAVFREVRRVLRPDGTVWLNLGDTYASAPGQSTRGGPKLAQIKRVGKSANKGHVASDLDIRPFAPGLKPKDLIGIPWRVALALQDDGWWLRQDIIWAKPNPMPESVTDRCTKAHEYLFLLTKSADYYFDAEAVAEAVAEATVERLAQPTLGDQLGSTRSPGKQGAMKAVSPKYSFARVTKNTAGKHGQKAQRRPGREDVAYHGRRNKRSVWTVAGSPFSGEFCTACRTYFEGDSLRALRCEKVQRDDQTVRIRHCRCGRTDAWLSHFATFPPDLIVYCIRAGTSEHGCCPSCAAPWERVVERALVKTRKACKTAVIDGRDLGADAQDQGSNRQRDGHMPGLVRSNTTTGWRPTCACHIGEDGAAREPLPPIPCTVLDPFGGAGTTALVADREQRRAILIELNPDYAEMARQRIDGDGGGLLRDPVVLDLGDEPLRASA